MRIAVTGKTGQVVSALIERHGGHDLIALGRPGLDLSRPDSIAPAIRAARPDLVVSAAAYTGVDEAELHREQAMAINGIGAGEVARAAWQLSVPLIHLSSDYVFDGTKDGPYTEQDILAPLGVYGLSKMAGERAVRAAHPGAVILRTAWIYSPFGHNFVKTMLRLAATRDEIAVVADQIGNPTSALDMADAVLALAERLAGDGARKEGRVFHLAGSGEASWADLAEAVFAASTAAGGPWARVRPITAAQYPAAAMRPANSRLFCGAMADAHGIRLPDWRASAAQVVSLLVRTQEKAI
ncbi:dTDP-4-dehydrorhamnose reductase [Novosphingobium sp. SG751A]|uniref:dTDP-4-dehydrorhamnose reductase n=1 Tax=Novosphingobium sp. SG751A TaxID=2587000 RepID=UPI00155643E8|nr:dTDP-4-dehydrorhamnose reductase [Novosphingobium sp. SG751A]NOW46439.1 dTDP-4-dehydrorhamnose reductase [Novosphingobium sp. SG751A]